MQESSPTLTPVLASSTKTLQASGCTFLPQGTGLVLLGCGRAGCFEGPTEELWARSDSCPRGINCGARLKIRLKQTRAKATGEDSCRHRAQRRISLSPGVCGERAEKRGWEGRAEAAELGRVSAAAVTGRSTRPPAPAPPLNRPNPNSVCGPYTPGSSFEGLRVGLPRRQALDSLRAPVPLGHMRASALG